MSDKQEFEKYPELQAHIQKLAYTAKMTLSDWNSLLSRINDALQAASQPPAVKADYILDDIHQRIIAGQLKGMSLERAIYTVGYEDGRNVKGAETDYVEFEKAARNFWQTCYGKPFPYKFSEWAWERLSESPTAAGDGKEAAVAFNDWTQERGFQKDKDGVWYCINEFEEDILVAQTTADLYDIFKQQNK